MTYYWLLLNVVSLRQVWHNAGKHSFLVLVTNTHSVLTKLQDKNNRVARSHPLIVLSWKGVRGEV